MKKFKLIIATLVILASTISCNKEEVDNYDGRNCNLTVTDVHPKASKYQNIIDDFINRGAVGASVTVISPEGTWSKTAGKSDLQNKTPMTPCDLFKIGSISKTYTAVAIMKLYEADSLALDDRIDLYIPDRIISKIANGNSITIRQLLHHSSGVLDYFDDLKFMAELTNGSIAHLSAEDCLSYIYNQPANFSPGTEYLYSNTNYLLLGIIIKNILHKNSAYEAITELLILPNGYENTLLTLNPNVVNSYMSHNGFMKDFSDYEERAEGGLDRLDGGIAANSYDVASFLHDLMNGSIISDTSLDLMQEFSGDDNYGLGIFSKEFGNRLAVGHGGATFTFMSVAYHFKDINTTVCVLLNCRSLETSAPMLEGELFENLY